MFSSQSNLRISFILILALLSVSCATWKKLDALYLGEASLPSLVGKDTTSALTHFDQSPVKRDTLKVKDPETGRELFFMKTFTDENTGEVTASEVLDAASITARFRNVSERGGEVDLCFDIVVPSSVRNSKWQVQLFPILYVSNDSIYLKPVMITGQEYRKRQLRGYEHYEKLISSIVTDPKHYFERKNFEIFLARNLPEVYMLKRDTTIMSDEAFQSLYGLSEQDILDHYSHKERIVKNQKRANALTRMHSQLHSVKTHEGIRLDTVLVDGRGDYTYQYIYTMRMKSGIRKADIVLSGEILEMGEVVYQMPRTEPYTFYISSTSTLAVPEEKYLKEVLERRVEANLSAKIEFAVGKSKVDPSFGNNASQFSRIKQLLLTLLQDKEYDVDSIVVSAFCSPEGSFDLNKKLSKERGNSISAYLNDYINTRRDSLERAYGMRVDEYGGVHHYSRKRIPFVIRSVGEDWSMLDMLVIGDNHLDQSQKDDYQSLREVTDLDHRESLLRQKSFYPYILDSLYSQLRRVDFNFYLQRKDMVRDTVMTTVIDTVYQNGLAALKEMDYQRAADLLAPYKDYNTAVAAVGANRNRFALDILNKMIPTAKVHYLLAIVYCRLGDEKSAVEHYLSACKADRTMVFRGNLDPEIYGLIKLYGLNNFEE